MIKENIYRCPETGSKLKLFIEQEVDGRVKKVFQNKYGKNIISKMEYLTLLILPN